MVLGDSNSHTAYYIYIKDIKMNDYTILVTCLYHSHMTIPINKDNLRSECERLRKILTFGEDTYKQIEVVNNETGEIREYWNSKQNETLF